MIETFEENSPATEQTAFEEIEITRLAFGSCYEPALDDIIVGQGHDSIWSGVDEFAPQVFLWLGDNFYTDVSIENGFPKEKYMPANTVFLEGETLSKFEKGKELELGFFQKGYNRILQQDNFQRFLENNPSVRVAATWDDHDFCSNDCFGEGDFSLAGRVTEEAKLESRQQFLHFLQQVNSDDSYSEYVESQKQWADAKQGIYSTYLLGKETRKIRVILLDTRYHQDPTEGALLGEIQWSWLENILKQDDGAVFTIIASSLQYFPDLKGGGSRRKLGRKFGESWGRAVKTDLKIEDEQLVKEKYQTDFSKERARLMRLIAKSKRKGVIFLSGDKHMGAIDYLSPEKQQSLLSEEDSISLGYPIYDITSSGLSHSFSTINQGIYATAANWLYKTNLTTQRHFGAIEIDWSNEENPSLNISLRTENNDIATTKNWKQNISGLKHSTAEKIALGGLGGRYIFKSEKPLSIQLSLQELSPNEY